MVDFFYLSVELNVRFLKGELFGFCWGVCVSRCLAWEFIGWWFRVLLISF